MGQSSRKRLCTSGLRSPSTCRQGHTGNIIHKQHTCVNNNSSTPTRPCPSARHHAVLPMLNP